MPLHQSRNPVPANNGSANGPLRKIVEYQEIQVGRIGTVIHELLECGHLVLPKQDIFGPTNAVRRRCRHCVKEREKS